MCICLHAFLAAAAAHCKDAHRGSLRECKGMNLQVVGREHESSRGRESQVDERPED